jgi:hypothetical protein
MVFLASILLVFGIGILPIGPAIVSGLLVGPRHTDVVVAIPEPSAPVADCDCGVPANPRGPR